LARIPGALRTRRHPRALLFVCAAFVAGVYRAYEPGDIPILVGALIALVSIWRRPGLSAAVLTTSCALAMLGGWWRGAMTAYQDGPAQVAHYVGHTVTLTGVVDGEPLEAGTGANLPVSVETLQVDGRDTAANGRLLVHYTGREAVEYGDRLWLHGTLSRPYQAPGFDYPAYLARQDIHAVIGFPSLRLVAHGAGNPLEHAALGVRAQLRRTLSRMLPQPEAALLTGILLGAPTHSLGSVTDAFVTAGMIHIVAISGLKVSLVAGMILVLVRPLRPRRRWLPAVVGVAGYVLITGATPSGLRSALMWLLAIVAGRTGRRSDVWVSLALVAAGLVAWHPALLWDAGFQLSVTGTAGIVVLTPWFERTVHWVPPVFRESLAVTLAAQVATLPITAMSFGAVSLVGPLANGLLLPLLGPLMVFGSAATLLATCRPALQLILGALLYPWLHGFILVVQALAMPRLAALPWPVVPLAWVTPYYAFLSLLVLWRTTVPQQHTRGHIRFARATVAAGGTLILTLPILALLLTRPNDRPTLLVAGAGHGTLLLLQAPGGQTMLVDGGDAPQDLRAVLGEHLPFWQRTITAVVVSAPDRTHLAGLTGLSDLYQVQHAYDTGAVFPSAAYAAWRADLRRAGIPRTTLRTGAVLDLGAGSRLDVLVPEILTAEMAPAPTAYRLHAGDSTVLLENREALFSELPLPSQVGCIDAAIIPPRATPAAVMTMLQALHPALVVLPPASGANDPLARFAPPSGTRSWRAGPGHDLRLTPTGHCTTQHR
jgi:competence protein ComEC